MISDKQSTIDELLGQQMRLQDQVKARNNAHIQHDDSEILQLLDDVQDQNNLLKTKLGNAADQMRKLANEKAQFVDMVNTLRAELRFWQGNKENASNDSTTQTDNIDKRLKPTLGNQAKSLAIATPTGTVEPITTKKALKSSNMGSSNVITKSKLPPSVSTSSPIKSQPSAVLPAKGPLTESQKQALFKMALRSRGVRNWNEQQD